MHNGKCRSTIIMIGMVGSEHTPCLLYTEHKCTDIWPAIPTSLCRDLFRGWETRGFPTEISIIILTILPFLFVNVVSEVLISKF